MADRNIAIRLSLKDGEVVKRALMKLGDDGQKALARIEAQAKPVSKGLLAVNAVTGELTAGMRGLSGRLGAVGAAFEVFGVKGLIAGAGVAAIVMGMKRMLDGARAATEEVAALGDTAEKLGVTAEQLQVLRFAAGQNGVAVGTLDMAWQRFTRRLGEAQAGTGEMIGDLQRYNIAVKNADGTNRAAIDVYKDLADTVRGVADPQERLRIAFKLFDSEGAALVTLMGQGSAALEAYGRQARDTGAIMSNYLVKAAKDTDDRLAELETQLKAVNADALVPLGQALVWIKELQVEVMRGLGDWASLFQGTAFKSNDFLRAAAEDLQDYIDMLDRINVGGVLDSYIESRKAKLAVVLDELKTRAAVGAAPADGAGGGIPVTKQALDRIKALKLERDGLRSLMGAYELSAGAVRAVTAAKKADEEISKLKLATGSAEAKQVEKLVKENEALNHAIQVRQQARAMNPDLVYKDRLSELEAMRRTGMVGEEELARATEDAERRRLSASRESADGIKRALLDIRDASQDTATQWESDVKSMNDAARSAFVDIASGAKSLADSLQGLLNSIQRTILGRVYDKTVGSFIDSALGDVFDGLFTSSAGAGPSDYGYENAHGGGVVGTGRGRTMAPPSVFASAPRFHGGGTVAGLGPGEVPIIALRRERVLTEAQQDNTAATIAGLARMAGQSPAITVKPTVYLAAPGVQARTESSWGAGGDLNIDVFVEEIEGRMGENIARGDGLAPVMEDRYSLNPAAGTYR